MTRDRPRGRLVVISGPSGVGKGTVVRALLARLDHARLSVSATTRPPRPGENDGVDYLFVDDDTFDRMARHGDLLEHAHVHGRRYGTPADWVRDQRDAGVDVLLEIDVQGALQVREHVPEAVLVFLAPPDLEELARRLQGRGTETPDQIRLRLDTAAAELAAAHRFDHVVVNDDLDRCLGELLTILS